MAILVSLFILFTYLIVLGITVFFPRASLKTLILTIIVGWGIISFLIYKY